MKVRVAQRGWRGAEPARTLDEVEVGLDCLWVELDGHRYDTIVGVDLGVNRAHFNDATLHVVAIGAVDLVYIGARGEELGAVPIDPITFGDQRGEDGILRLRAATFTDRPEPTTVDEALADRDSWRARALAAEKAVDIYLDRQ